MSPRQPPKISYKDNWMNELDTEVPGSSKDTQRIQPKPKTQLSRTVRPAGGQESTKEIEKGTLFDHEDVKHSTRTERPSCGSASAKKLRADTDKIEEDQTRTERPVKVEEHEIEFRVPGLSHAVVKETETFPSSTACEQDRKSSSSRSISCRLATEQRPQPIQQKFERDDARIVQYGVVRVVRNHTVLTVFFVGIKELCTALADNSRLTANPEESVTN